MEFRDLLQPRTTNPALSPTPRLGNENYPIMANLNNVKRLSSRPCFQGATIECLNPTPKICHLTILPILLNYSFPASNQRIMVKL